MKYDDNKPKASRYFLYARKSTESEDRQVASIDSQVSEMTKVAKSFGLTVVEVMSESGSGFKTGRRVFNEMLVRIEQGEADGIIVWKLSRLSRNPDDAGKIMGMLQREQIRHIRTVDRNWLPTDNVLMMYVEFGLTNQFSRDLRADTKRGLQQKAERGWYPGASLPLVNNSIRMCIFPTGLENKIVHNLLKKLGSLFAVLNTITLTFDLNDMAVVYETV